MWAAQALVRRDNRNINTSSDRDRTSARSLSTIRRTNHGDVADRAAVDRATIRQFGIKADNRDRPLSADRDSSLIVRRSAHFDQRGGNTSPSSNSAHRSDRR